MWTQSSAPFALVATDSQTSAFASFDTENSLAQLLLIKRANILIVGHSVIFHLPPMLPIAKLAASITRQFKF